MLSALSACWITKNEGPDTWSPFDIVGHLIHGEKTDWIPRARIILFEDDKRFEPFDRFAMFEASKNKTMRELLDEFGDLRKDNIEELKSFGIEESDLEKTGIHPEFGEVTLRNLLSTWTVHDLNHIAQIARVMGKLYKEEAGPWPRYIKLLRQ